MEEGLGRYGLRQTKIIQNLINKKSKAEVNTIAPHLTHRLHFRDHQVEQ